MEDARWLAEVEGITVNAAKLRLIRAQKPRKTLAAKLEFLYKQFAKQGEELKEIRAIVVRLEAIAARAPGRRGMPSDDAYMDAPQ